MFDQDNYYSDQQDNVYKSHKAIVSSKVLAPSSNSDFNHLTGDSQSLLKMMKERGIDLTDNEIKKMKVKNNQIQKPVKQLKGRSGFFDGGAAATVQQLIKALNKALSKADPQQASCILSYLLQKKKISIQDINKFGVMKCKILFGLGAYKDCQQKAQQLIIKANTKLNKAIFSNYLAKCKAQNNKIFEGYLDLLRSKSLINDVKLQEQNKVEQPKQINKSEQQQQQQQQKPKQKTQAQIERQKLQTNFKDYEVDSVIRQIDYTELEYNIKMAQMKNCLNNVYPYYSQFKNRRVTQIVCGDFHVLFLVKGSYDSIITSLNDDWKTQVFGMGQNGVGQVLGKSTSFYYKQPVLIPQLSGKGITGLYAFKQSSIAYNNKGQIYQWGVKQIRNNQISLTYNVGQQIQSIQKGNKHYALMTKSKKFYTWGQIQSRGVVIYKQPKPFMQQSANIINYSCGSSCIICVDSNGQAFGLGNNQFNQMCLKGQYFSKTFKKIPDHILGKVAKVFCIADCTFFVNQDHQIYFSGKYSHNKQSQQNLRQAQFSGEVVNLISICGHIGTYYLTNQKGQIYKWDVDSNVKFRLYKENPQINQRYVVSQRGQLFRVKNQIQPQYCSVKQITKDPQSYEDINFQIQLKDKFGLYGNKQFFVAPRCQIHLSTFQMPKQQILKENKQFLERYKLSTFDNRILLNQIIDPKLYSYKITRNQDQPWIFNLDIVIDTSGKYYFYVVLQQTLLFNGQLPVSLSAKQNQMSQKNLSDKKAKQQQRRRRAQQQKKRLLQQKLRKQQQQQQKRKQTQRRAEQALKRHMKQQQQAKLKQMQQRKARKQLQTGGGFDLSKLVKKKSSQLKPESIKQLKQSIKVQKNEMQKTTQSFKTSQSFLPDINVRPSSRKKLTFRKDSLDSAKIGNPLQKTAGFTNDSKGFLSNKPRDLGKTLGETKTAQILKSSTTTTETTSKPIVKRGLSRTKK